MQTISDLIAIRFENNLITKRVTLPSLEHKGFRKPKNRWKIFPISGENNETKQNVHLGVNVMSGST
jgi:hypothetical protein